MQIMLDVPEQYPVDSGPAERGRRVKLNAALMMFHAGEISAGAAAEFAGVDRFSIAAECRRRGIPLVDHPAGELGAEADSLRELGFCCGCPGTT